MIESVVALWIACFELGSVPASSSRGALLLEAPRSPEQSVEDPASGHRIELGR